MNATATRRGPKSTLELHLEADDLLDQVLAITPLVHALTATSQRSNGFLNAETRDLLDRQARDERLERRAQPLRQHADGTVLIGLKWLNRTTTAAGTGQIPAPGNLRGISTDVDIWFTLRHQAQLIQRRRNATVLPRANVLAVPTLAQDPDVADLVAHLRALIDLTPSSTAIAGLNRDLRHLLDQAETLVEGEKRIHVDEDCPHCGLRSLVYYPRIRLTRCEHDIASRARTCQPCRCDAAICDCTASPITFRHEWHMNHGDRTATSLSVHRLAAQIKHAKENRVLETTAQDALGRIRALHRSIPIYPFAENCPAEPGTHEHEELESGDLVCITCGPVTHACEHCTHDSDDTFEPYPCTTIRAIDGDDNEETTHP